MNKAKYTGIVHQSDRFYPYFLRIANLLNMKRSNPDKCYLYPGVTEVNLQQNYQTWNRSGKYIK